MSFAHQEWELDSTLEKKKRKTKATLHMLIFYKESNYSLLKFHIRKLPNTRHVHTGHENNCVCTLDKQTVL
jgi:hypothetical protein